MPTDWKPRSRAEIARVRSRELRRKARKAQAWENMKAAFAAKRAA